MLASVRQRITLLALCLASFALQGCGSHAFDVVRIGQASLSAGDDAGAMRFAGFEPVTLLTDQILELQHIVRRQVAGVKVHAVTLTVAAPGSSQDLTFLQNVSVTISAAGLPTKTLATGQNFTAGQNVGVLQVEDDDFVDYFSKVDPTLSVAGQGQAPIDLVLEAEVAFALQISSNTILFQ